MSRRSTSRSSSKSSSSSSFWDPNDPECYYRYLCPDPNPCRRCGREAGHTAADCPSSLSDPSQCYCTRCFSWGHTRYQCTNQAHMFGWVYPASPTREQLVDTTCHRCKQKGHLARRCPK